MLDSVRVRLTLWYTAVLAVVLVALSLITYFIFWQSTVQRTDANLTELSNAFLTTLDAEINDQSGPDAFKLAGQVAVTEHRFRDHVFAIFDGQGNLVARKCKGSQRSRYQLLGEQRPFRPETHLRSR